MVTGWTIKTVVAKHIQDDQYAAIGQLYSPTRGISLLLRNLLLNPHVDSVVILDATKEDKSSGACQCLADFFENGFVEGLADTGQVVWSINSDIKGYVDREIHEEALESLRKSIQHYRVSSIKEMVDIVGHVSNLPQVRPTRQTVMFPISEARPRVYPGSRYGHRVEGKTIAEAWVKIIHRIKTFGTIRPTGYDGYWQELINVMAVIEDEPEEFFIPSPNYLPVDRAFLNEYIPQILEDSPHREDVKYTYGQRLRSWFGVDQIEQVIGKLVGEIDAASAVMSLWDVKDHEVGGSPCLNHIWVRVVDKKLSLTAVFRSNDMFSAWVANAMGLRALQMHILNEVSERANLNLELGHLITISQSAHIYDDSWDNANELIKKQYSRVCRQSLYGDPVGNFVIETQAKELVVIQTAPEGGEVVREYRSQNPLALLREICDASPNIHPSHAGYLGLELQKAWSCLRSGKEYVQDL